MEEARRRLRELALPFFHHETVKQALLAGMQVRHSTVSRSAAHSQSSGDPESAPRLQWCHSSISLGCFSHRG